MVQGPDKRKSPRVGMSLVIRVQHESRAEFVSSYATNISQGGIFIRTTKPLPVGTVLNFRLELKGSETMLRGIGQVVWTRDPAAPGEDFRQPGMGVKFLKLDRNSKNLVRRIVEIKVGKAAAEKAEKAVREAGQEPAEMATGRGDSDRAPSTST